ncbi:MAG: glycoside hydrolase family 65 protein [Oscillospiraceae bacterium]|nr:glycoside hydrolase family 65 protein [Oscillospiraceae bacterium]
MLDFSMGKGWALDETSFDPAFFGKVEANFSLGNGYLGLRSAHEENYLGQTRDLLVAGTFDRFSPEEVTELPNAADVTNIEITLNGERFDLTTGRIMYYVRRLDLKTGMLSRDVTWQSPKGELYSLHFKRIVSLKRLHTIAFQISVIPRQETMIRFQSGIDGRMTCDGSQHFTEGQTRFYDKKYLQFVPRTIQSDITFVVDATHDFYANGEETQPVSDINISRRHMFSNFTLEAEAGEVVTMEKFCNVFTTRDREAAGMTTAELQAFALDRLKEDQAAGFQSLAEESAAAWREKVWDRVPITVDGPEFDQLVIRFAQYHLQLMTPAHDNRMNIGAKGFSGEGYKGHVFWDTEIFLLPYFIFNMPEAARSLEEYRYLSLPGAHAKAKHNGYDGAQFPWESAWLDDGEVTPEYMGTDVVTGQLIKVWTGFIEIHITSDVAFGAWSYYKCTGDQDFMDKYGYELIFDCAKFWASRLEPGEDGLLHINDVVGPDEYKEHVDDNAFTNYLAKWTIDKAIEYADLLSEENPELFAQLEAKLGIMELREKWAYASAFMFLTKPNENGVLPQDSTYLTLQDIDLTKYKNQAHVGGIYKDYNQEQITKMQVSKQADVMVLFYLLEDLFPREVKVSSFNYYEPRCLHDSSLSLCTHSMLSADVGNVEQGYQMFQKACMIDLDNANPHSSDAGIHAASMGGLWQCAVQGFGGLRMLGGKLRISPNMPQAWNSLRYTAMWQGQRIAVTAEQNRVELVNETGSGPVEVEVWGAAYTLTDRLTVTK